MGLPAIDSLECAIVKNENAQDNAFYVGIKKTISMFADILNSHQITAIEPKAGDIFSPNEHQAIETVSGEQNNTIVSLKQKGYKIHEQVIRPAWVSVSIINKNTNK